MTTRADLLHEGKSKRVFATSDAGLVWVEYKDSATAFDGTKKATVGDKGRVNAAISAHLMGLVGESGVPTHLVSVLSATEQLCRKVEIIPVEVVVRNVVAGSMARRYGIPEGKVLSRPLVELFYKSDALHDPPVSDEACAILGWAEPWELAYLRHAALRVNAVLSQFWETHGVRLVDFKLEFGRAGGTSILLADEISPDGSRLWEHGTDRRLDKDVFRRDLADLGDTYRELYARVFGQDLPGKA